MIRRLVAVCLAGWVCTGALAAQTRPAAQYVGTVSFKGNESLDPVLLAASIATTSSSWLYRHIRIGDRQPWDDIEFRRDVVRLQLLYRQHGFYEAKIDTTVRRSGRFVSPTFHIVEGPFIEIDTVAVTGVDSVRDARSVGRGLQLKAGDRFDRVLFDASGDSILFTVRDRGYPYAIVFRNFTVNRLTRRATVQYDVLTGPHARIGDISITGTERVQENTVRRALTIRQNDEYRATALYNSQRTLYQSELFRYANVAIAQPDSAVGGQDSLVRVRVNVAESNPLRARAGIGYGSIDCLRGQGTVTILNFLGEARRLDIASRVSKIGVGRPADFGLEHSLCPELKNDIFSTEMNYLGSVTLSQPVGFVRGGLASIQAFKERRSEFNAYLLTSAGGALSLRFGIGANRGIPLALSYRLSSEQTTATEATFCTYFNQCDPTTISSFSAARRQGALTASLVNQNVDSPIEPTTGQTLTVEFTTANRALASQIVFDRLVVEGVGYRRVGRRRVLSARLRGGIVREGQSEIGGQRIRFVPPAELFYAGGPTTVRGFGRNEMGPVVFVFNSVDTSKTDSDSLVGLRASPIGSAAIILANLELLVPTPFLGGKLGLSGFIDGGELWAFNGSTYQPGGFRITPGIGLQIGTPLGPMRLTAAYNGYRSLHGRLYQIQGDTLVLRDPDYTARTDRHSFLSRLQWHFSVGVPF